MDKYNNKTHPELTKPDAKGYALPDSSLTEMFRKQAKEMVLVKNTEYSSKGLGFYFHQPTGMQVVKVVQRKHPYTFLV